MLCMQTRAEMGVSLALPGLYAFVFFSTLFMYNAYYLQTARKGFHLVFCIIGMIGFLFAIPFLAAPQYGLLLASGILCLLYALPVWIKSNSFAIPSLIRLVILITTWLLVTYFLVLPSNLSFEQHMLSFIFRFLLLAIACMLFYYKDDTHAFRKKIFSFIVFVLIGVYVFLALYLHPSNLPNPYFLAGMYMLVVSCMCFYSERTAFFYLLFVDGILLVQSIFVLAFTLSQL